MKKKTKRLFSFLLSLALVLGLMAGLTVPAKAETSNSTSYPLWVGGKQVNSVNASDIEGDQANAASYDAENSTLTLNGYHYTGGTAVGIQYTGSETLTIQLAQGSDNRITIYGDYEAISVSGNLIIKGQGALTAVRERSAAGKEKAAISAETVTIGSEVELHAKNSRGHNAIVGKVKYAVDGVGTDYNEGERYDILVSSMPSGGADLSQYDWVEFPKEYPLSINGNKVTSANKSGNGWDFTPATNTDPAALTLTDFHCNYDGSDLDEPSGRPNYSYGCIDYSGSSLLKIVLNGTNVIAATGSHKGSSSNTEAKCYVYGIRSNGGDLAFVGTGSLTVSGFHGIGGPRNVSFESCTVNAYTENNSQTLPGVGYGIFASYYLTIAGEAAVTASSTSGAIDGTVKNAIPGIGWDNAAGDGDGTSIAVNTQGQKVNSYKKVKFPHIHSFIYSGEGATITATCGAAACNLDDGTEQHHHTVRLTIGKPTLTVYGQTGYNVNANAKLDGLDDFNAATKKKIAVTNITYYKAAKDGTTYSIVRGAAPLTAAPAAAGDYMAVLELRGVKISETQDDGTVTASIGYTIARASSTPAAVTANSRTCDETDQPLVTVDDSKLAGGTMYYAVTTDNTAPADDNLYTPSIPTRTDVGTYYVWYKAVGDSNHLDSDPGFVTVTISEANQANYNTIGIVNNDHEIGKGEDVILIVKGIPDDSQTAEKYVGVSMNQIPVPEEYTRAEKGSLILTIKSEYLDTLSAGNYKTLISFTDGHASAAIRIIEGTTEDDSDDIPKTGDSGNPAIWMGLLLLGLIGSLGVVRLVRRKEK